MAITFMGGTGVEKVVIRTWSTPNTPTGEYYYQTHSGETGKSNSFGHLPSGVRHPTATDAKRIRELEEEKRTRGF